MNKRYKAFLLCALGLGTSHTSSVAGQWKPEQHVEIIITAAAGSNNDLTMRTIQGIWQNRKMVPIVQVVNHPGGGGAIAYTYLSQRAPDPHYLSILAPTMLTSHIEGKGRFHHSDFTSIALLLSRHIYVTVRADSPIKTGRDLIERLRKDPASLSVAVSSAIGNAIHLGIALPMKAAGVDIKKMKVVAFKSAGVSMTNLLGGHIDVVASAFGTVLPQLSAGKVRVIGVSAAERLPGMLANVPTWREQGANAVFSSWLGVVGAKGLSASQVAYWENAFAVLSRTEEWTKDAAKNYQIGNYMNSRDVRRYWDTQYGELKEILTDLGLAKRLD